MCRPKEGRRNRWAERAAPKKGRRGTAEGQGQGQRGNRGRDRRRGKEGRRTHGANQGHREGQAGQGQGPTQVVALNKAEGSKWRARILALHPPISDEYAPKEQARRCTFSRRGWEPVTSSSFGGCFLTFRMTKKRKLREEEEDEYRHHKLDRDRADCRDLGQADHAGAGSRRLPADDRHRDDRSTARRFRRAVARREGSNGVQHLVDSGAHPWGDHTTGPLQGVRGW